MDNLISMEFPISYDEFGDINLTFSTYEGHYNDSMKKEQSTNSESVNLEMKRMDSKNPSLIYDFSVKKDMGTIIDKSVNLEYLLYNKADNDIVAKQVFKDNLLINKIEFDRSGNKIVTVKVEFQADTKEDAKKIKDKAKAYNIVK